MDSKSLAAVCCLGWKYFHMELGVPPSCAVCGLGAGHEGTPRAPRASRRAPKVCGAVQGSRSSRVEQRCLPRLRERPSPAPGPVTGSSKTPGVQRHFMLTERFSARNLRLNKLESSLRRKQKMEGEELALSCTARSRCTLENSQVRCTPNPRLAGAFRCGARFVPAGSTVGVSVLVPRLPTPCTPQRHPRCFLAFRPSRIYSGFTSFLSFHPQKVTS